MALAKDFKIRVTYPSQIKSDLPTLLKLIKSETGFELNETDLLKVEETPLANSNFTMWVQTFKGIQIKDKGLRLWTKPSDDSLVQFEADVSSQEVMPTGLAVALIRNRSAQTAKSASLQVAIKAIQFQEDNKILKSTIEDFWVGSKLIRVVKLFAKRGIHKVEVSLLTGKVVSSSYRGFPQDELFSIPAKAFLIWEEDSENLAAGSLAPRSAATSPVRLKYLFPTLKLPNSDPFVELNKQRYLGDLMDPIKSLDPAFQDKGYWSLPQLRNKALVELSKFPQSTNFFGGQGLTLHGRYASINIVREAFTAFKGIVLEQRYAPTAGVSWNPTQEDPEKYEAKLEAPFLGKSFASQEEVNNLEIFRHPQHDPVYYINNGFDQIQVYFAINQMFESLWSMGFTDPELSTRAFEAFLYHPDVESRDNAFYNDDTINFSTYSNDARNYARDNTTIWHELGHGIMDRLMGSRLNLADTGGLSEGMADFIAQLVIDQVTKGDNFDGKQSMRIINNTGFSLTNEEHDDGEAYGGAMNDMLTTAYSKYGYQGIVKITDLTLEAMRLCRNHPGLTAQDWFNQMLFADERGSSLRVPAELKQIILSSLASRNFTFTNEPPASLVTLIDGAPMVQDGLGTRYNPIQLEMGPNESKNFKIKVSLQEASFYRFKYPVQVKVQTNSSPLQGAVHWVNEEKGPQIFTLNSPSDFAEFELSATGICDEINSASDQGCKDYAHILIFNAGNSLKPQAKKRFYLKIKPKSSKSTVYSDLRLKVYAKI